MNITFQRNLKRVLIVSVLIVELILSVVLYMESLYQYRQYDVAEFVITLVLVSYLLYVINQNESLQDSITERVEINKKKPFLALKVVNEERIDVFEGSWEAIGLQAPILFKQFKSLFTDEAWNNIYSCYNYEGNLVISFVEPKNIFLSFKSVMMDNSVVIWLIDMTEAKEAELELVNLFHEYRSMAYKKSAIVNNISTPIWLRDKTGKIIYQNEAYSSFLKKAGYEYESDEMDICDGKLGINKRSFIVDNKAVTLEIDESEISVGSLGVAHDVSDIIKLEKKLGGFKESFEFIVDEVEDAVLLLDDKLRLVAYNSKFFEYFHISADEINNKPNFQVLLDIMRQNGRLPEVKNFKEFKDTQLKTLLSVKSEYSEIMHTSTFTMLFKIIPFTSGYKIITYKDI